MTFSGRLHDFLKTYFFSDFLAYIKYFYKQLFFIIDKIIIAVIEGETSYF
jgi:hypothetical protein